eukprot:8385051-Alexandrium_andersonii.AAC.1
MSGRYFRPGGGRKGGRGGDVPGPSGNVESVLVNRCMHLYSIGLLSATSLQYIVEGALQDGLANSA